MFWVAMEGEEEREWGSFYIKCLYPQVPLDLGERANVLEATVGSV